MKKQIKTNWQTIVFAAIAAVVFMLVTGSSIHAQGTYKVGDKVEVFTAGTWNKAEIVKVVGNGTYEVNFVWGNSGAQYNPKNMRPMEPDTQSNGRNNNDTQPNGNPQAPKGDGTKPKPQSSAIFKRFGSREPRTCDDTKAPARGAITAALALKYLNCQMEKIWSTNLYLVENVKVEVGGGIPYAAIMGQYSLDQIDVKYPVYPIRGSLLRYQCKDLLTEHDGPPDTNCNTYNEPKATGHCYKTTFGDWKCDMSDGAGVNKENWRRNVAPPKR